MNYKLKPFRIFFTKVNTQIAQFYLLIFIVTYTQNVVAQSARGAKIAFVDMEYILENTTSYQQAISMIDQKAQKWKQDIEAKEADIKKLRENLKTEQILLTQELIDEKLEEIEILESEVSDLRQKRFGSNGDFFVQKAVLIKPIQDQVFTIVRDIAEVRKYDFVFDKASDLTMLFAAKKFDISDIVVKQINRAEKIENMTKKQLEKFKEDQYKEDEEDLNPALTERKRKLDEFKAKREKMMEERKLAQEERKNQQAAARQKKLDKASEKKDNNSEAVDEAKNKSIAERQQKIKERQEALDKLREEQKLKREKAIEERKQLQSANNDNQTNDNQENKPNENSEAEKTKQEREQKLKAAQDARNKSLEERQKLIEVRKLQMEQKKLELQQQREKAIEERNKKIKEKLNNNPEN